MKGRRGERRRPVRHEHDRGDELFCTRSTSARLKIVENVPQALGRGNTRGTQPLDSCRAQPRRSRSVGVAVRELALRR